MEAEVCPTWTETTPRNEPSNGSRKYEAAWTTEGDPSDGKSAGYDGTVAARDVPRDLAAIGVCPKALDSTPA